MAVTATPIYPQTLVNDVLAIVNADASTTKSLSAAGASGSRYYSISVQSTDTSSRDMQIHITRGGTNYQIGTISVLASSGNTNAIVTIDLLRSVQLPFLSYDALGNRVLDLASGSTLSFAMATTITSGKQVTIFAQRGDF